MDATRYTIVILFCFMGFGTASVAIRFPPVIVRQPSSEELNFLVAIRQDDNDIPFVIECEAEGDPQPKYNWTKNSKPFNWDAYDDRMSQMPGKGTFVVTSPRDEDIGQYQCFAYNELGTATSNSVYVRRAEINSFPYEEPVVIVAEEGRPFKLTCHPPDGWPKPVLDWMLQDQNGALRLISSPRLTTDPEGSLWFSNLTQSDRSVKSFYTCSACIPFSEECKFGNSVYVSVSSINDPGFVNKNPPIIQYASRRHTVALRGKTTSLWCIIGGSPLPEIKWKKNENPVIENDRIAYGNYGKTLQINNIDFSDEGTYHCEATNGVGTPISYSINLHVYAIPFFTIEPEIVNSAVGETAKFHCEAGGNPAPEIIWIHNGKPLEEAVPNPRRRFSGNEIIIEMVNVSDTGNYGCNATNPFGYVYKDVYLNVFDFPAEIIEKPENKVTTYGNSVTLKCRVFGSPKPIVRWFKPNREVAGGRFHVLHNGDLEIRNVTFRDSGEYTCFARNKFRNDTAKATLTVKEHTRITDRPEDVEVPIGTNVTFRCGAVTDVTLTPKIEWLAFGYLIDFEDDDWNAKLEKNNTLAIYMATIYNSGVYTCRARTELDEATASVTLTVQNVPSEPDITEVTCGQWGTNITWEALDDNANPILSFSIQYKNNYSRNTWEIAIKDLPATTKSCIVPFLPWINYIFRVIAYNKIGSSHPSIESEKCTVPPDVPFINPDGVSVHRLSPGNLVVFWTPIPKLEHNAPAFKYKVQWKQDNGYSDWDSQEVNNWEQNNFTITHPTTHFPYLIRVWAVNGIGPSKITPKDVPEYVGQYITTRYCQKINNSAEQNKCLDNLKLILTSSDLNIDDILLVLKIFEEVIAEDSNFCSSSSYDILQISQLVYNVTSNAKTKTTKLDWVKIADAVLNVFGNLMVNRCKWEKIKKDEMSDVFTEFLEIMDSTTLSLAERISDHKNNSKIFHPLENNTVKSNIVVFLGAIEEIGNKLTRSNIYIDDEEFSSLTSISLGIEQHNFWRLQSRLIYAVAIRPIYMENIINNTVKSFEENGTQSYSQSREFNGKLVSLVFNMSIQLKHPKIRVQFANTHEEVGYSKNVYRRKLHLGEHKKAVGGSSICVVWDKKDKVWSTLGCYKTMSNRLVTTCECNHTTAAFSVLASFHDYSGKDYGLQILTWTILALCIVCLILSLISFAVEKPTGSETRISIHLCVALIGGNIFLIFGDKDNFHLSDPTCTALGVLTHFSWLCAFGWIAVEGIHLYVQVVKILSPTDHLFKIYYFIGYGIPLLTVAITFTIGFSMETDNIYVGEMFCWLQGRYIWAFMAPVLLICVGNTLGLFIAKRIAKNRKTTTDHKGICNKKFNGKLGTMLLTAILGASWIFGSFTLVDVHGHIFLSYIFTILNASQGVFIFIFRCCMNKNHRLALRRLLCGAFLSLSSKSAQNFEIEMKNESSLEISKNKNVVT